MAGVGAAVHLDLRDEGALAKLPTDVEMIIHLAANARVYELVENPDRARDNLLTLFSVLEYARKNDIRKFIFASSREGYGNIDEEALTEDMVRVENCESPYTASKVGGEAFVHAYAGCYGLRPVIIRFSNVYGMYDGSERVIPQFIRQAKAGEVMHVFGEEKCLDFTYIDDAIQGVLLIVDKYDVVGGETFNIAYGEGSTIVELAEKIKELLQSSSEIRIEEPRTGEIIRYVANISKAKEVFGYSPQTSFAEGVRKSVEWYAQHT